MCIPTVPEEDWNPQGECSRPKYEDHEKGDGGGTNSRRVGYEAMKKIVHATLIRVKWVHDVDEHLERHIWPHVHSISGGVRIE